MVQLKYLFQNILRLINRGFYCNVNNCKLGANNNIIGALVNNKMSIGANIYVTKSFHKNNIVLIGILAIELKD